MGDKATPASVLTGSWIDQGSRDMGGALQGAGLIDPFSLNAHRGLTASMNPASLLDKDFRDDILSGKGTPWGAMETGRPDNPQFEEYMTDPNDPRFKTSFANFEAQKQKEAALGGGSAQRGYQAQQAKMFGGGSSSADANRRMADIAAQTQYGQNKISADVAQAELDAAMRKMSAYNQAKQMANQIKADLYNNESQKFNAEQQGRAKLISDSLGTIGTVAGSIWGGKAGNLLGAGANSLGRQATRGNENPDFVDTPGAPSLGVNLNLEDMGPANDFGLNDAMNNFESNIYGKPKNPGYGSISERRR